MANKLVERLLGIDDQGAYQSRPFKITSHAFSGAYNEFKLGNISSIDIKTFWDMSDDCYNELLALSDLNLEYTHIKSILYLSEALFTGYATCAEVRTKLGL